MEKTTVENCGDLYNYMRKKPEVIGDFIDFISNAKWKLKSFKMKPDRITMHIFNGSVTKPLYIDNEMYFHENGKKSDEKVQAIIRERIDFFIIQFFSAAETMEGENV